MFKKLVYRCVVTAQPTITVSKRLHLSPTGKRANLGSRAFPYTGICHSLQKLCQARLCLREEGLTETTSMWTDSRGSLSTIGMRALGILLVVWHLNRTGGWRPERLSGRGCVVGCAVAEGFARSRLSMRCGPMLRTRIYLTSIPNLDLNTNTDCDARHNCQNRHLEVLRSGIRAGDHDREPGGEHIRGEHDGSAVLDS